MTTAKRRNRTRSVATFADVEGEGEGAERLLRPLIVARRLDCDPSTLRRMINEGRFPAPLQIGNMTRWRERDVNAWIAGQSAEVKAPEPPKRSRRGG